MPAAKAQFIGAEARADAQALAPLPNSRKIHVAGSRPDIQVPMREIQLSPTVDSPGAPPRVNPPLRVYDSSGPYTDPDVQIDIRKGLPRIRENWIDQRDDSDAPRPTLLRIRPPGRPAKTPRLALSPAAKPPSRKIRRRHPNGLRQARNHHPRNGIRRHPRKPPKAAPRVRHQRGRGKFRRRRPRRSHPRIRPR